MAKQTEPAPDLRSQSRDDLVEIIYAMQQDDAAQTVRAAGPTAQAVAAERARLKQKAAYRGAVVGTLGVLLVVAALAVLCSTYFLTVLQIQGTSMAPTLQDGEIVLALRTASCDSGDVVAFYYNNKLLVKRVIGKSGDRIDLAQDGTVLLNDAVLQEPYITEPALGPCDIPLPYQVPDRRYFLMGDHRATSVDSRSSAIGCVSSEQMAGRVVLKIWPLSDFGPLP